MNLSLINESTGEIYLSATNLTPKGTAIRSAFSDDIIRLIRAATELGDTVSISIREGL